MLLSTKQLRSHGDRGSVAVEFLAASVGALAITGATLLVVVAGLARIAETEAVTTAATRALWADQSQFDAAGLRASLEQRLNHFPIHLKLRTLSVAVSGRATSAGPQGRSASVTAFFALPGLEVLGLGQEVRVNVGSELN